MKYNKKMIFIYNQKAGKTAIKSNLADVIDIFTKGGYEVVVHPTQSAGDAYETAMENAGQYDVIACAGGDGTLADVTAGVHASGKDTPIGYIPCGSTNDFAASLGFPKTIKAAARAIVKGKAYPIDFGAFNEKNFIYIAAFGWFTDVSYKTDQNLKNVFGHAAYILEAGKRLFEVPEYTIKAHFNHKVSEVKCVYGMITNTRSVGGIKDFAWKEIEMDDGLFEVTIIRTPANVFEMSEAATALISGEPNKLIYKFKTNKIEIESNSKISWTLDGEEAGSYKNVKIENLHKAVNIILSDEK